MKRLVLPLLVVALAAAAFLTRESWLPKPAGRGDYLGYVEGKTVLVAAGEAGRLVSVQAVKGAGVKQGTVLFGLDPAAARASLARAEAAADAARAAHRNLLTGKREEEIAVIRAQIGQAEAGLALAQKELQRATTLASSGTAARSRLDQAAEQVDYYGSRLRELRAAEQVAGLAARGPEIEAAAARIREAEAQVEEARHTLADLTPLAPTDAAVEYVFFEAGEWVAAGQPVVALLPPSGITLRFFVPEAALARAAPGTRINFRCDGCGDVKTGVITAVAAQPEFTPPVIYSEGARSKLVYLVEARPDAADAELRPGLPIDVEPLT